MKTREVAFSYTYPTRVKPAPLPSRALLAFSQPINQMRSLWTVASSNGPPASLDKRSPLGSPAAVPSADLEKIVLRLNDLQRQGIIGLHAIGGAFAFIFYAEPINTRDLDVFAELPTVGGLILLDGFPVQILPAPTPLVQEAIVEARTVEIGKERTRVFSAEHAVAIALQTNRAKDRLKIEHLLESGKDPLDEVRLRTILARHGLEERWNRFVEAQE
jgi:hypothetical protein